MKLERDGLPRRKKEAAIRIPGVQGGGEGKEAKRVKGMVFAKAFLKQGVFLFIRQDKFHGPGGEKSFSTMTGVSRRGTGEKGTEKRGKNPYSTKTTWFPTSEQEGKKKIGKKKPAVRHRGKAAGSPIPGNKML